MRFLLGFAALGIATSCSPIDQKTLTTGSLPSSAYFALSDADSGYIKGIEPEIHFRLHGVDAPEDRSPRQRGGAKCLGEQALGDAAGDFARALVSDVKQIAITTDYGPDQYGRLVVDISLDGDDMGTLLIEAGHAALWDYDGGAPKPNWCPA